MAATAAPTLQAPGAATAAATLQSRQIEDPSDRAARLVKDGNVRISLDLLGFNPENRGNRGLIPYHSHETVWDCMANGVKRSRYKEVAVALVPDNRKDHFLTRNRHEAANDPLMPKFAPDMRYCLLTKTHFCHGLKLAKDGGRTLFNEGKVPILLNEEDDEGGMCLQQGVVCVIYDSAIFQDVEALNTVMNTDNLNAACEMQADEMQNYGAIESILLAVGTEANGSYSSEKICAAATRQGVKVPVADIKSFVAFRSSLPQQLSDVFNACQKHDVKGRVRVRAADFGAAATINPQCPWMKVALMMAQYLSPLVTKAGIAGSSGSVPGTGSSGPVDRSESSFVGRQEIHAKRLPVSYMKQLAQEGGAIATVEVALKQILKTYSVTAGSGGDQGMLMSARSLLLYRFGRILLTIGEKLDKAHQKLAAVSGAANPVLSAREVADAVRSVFDSNIASVEAAFRCDLQKAGAYKNAPVPPPVHSMPSDSGTKRGSGEGTAAAVPVAREFDKADNTSLTEQDVRTRLGLIGVAKEVVRCRRVAGISETLHGVKHDVKEEQPEDGDGNEDKLKAAFGENDVIPVRLISLHIPYADVETDATQPDGTVAAVQFRVQVDSLFPAKSVKKELPISEMDPCGIDPGATKEDLLPYDVQALSTRILQSMAAFGLEAANLNLHESAAGVSVHVMSESGKLPLVLQARAARAFKKGELVLLPVGGDLETDCEPSAKLQKLQERVLHRSLSPCSTGVIRCIPKKRRAGERGEQGSDKDEPDENEVQFRISTPLLAAASSKDASAWKHNLASFWSIPHTVSLSSVNLQEEDFFFEIQPPQCVGKTMPSWTKKMKVTLKVTGITNTKKLDVGDILALPLPAASTQPSPQTAKKIRVS